MRVKQFTAEQMDGILDFQLREELRHRSSLCCLRFFLLTLVRKFKLTEKLKKQCDEDPHAAHPDPYSPSVGSLCFCLALVTCMCTHFFTELYESKLQIKVCF